MIFGGRNKLKAEIETLQSQVSTLEQALQASLIAGLPPSGRSSVDEPKTLLGGIEHYAGWLGDLSPAVPYKYTACLSRIAFINPTLKNALMNWKVLANSGHEVIIEAASDSRADAAREVLNRLAYRVNEYGAGMDGLIDKLILQVGITGACSRECVIDQNRREIADIVAVPVEKIRFKKAEGKWLPHQLTTVNQYIRLNSLTYKYTAWEQFENNPYGIPPLLSALQPILDQLDMDKNIRFIIKKFGILGLTTAIFKPPQKTPGEGEREYRNRLVAYLDKQMEAFAKNFNNGLIGAFDDTKIEHTNTTGEARGANDLYMQNVHKIGSGSFTPLAFLSYSDSVTETFANVVYRIYIRLTENLRRPVKRSLENAWRLALALEGIEVDWVSMGFNQVPERDPQSIAQAEDLRYTTAIHKAEKGMVDPDLAAQEMGYDGWYDVERLYNSGSSPFGLKLSDNRRVYKFKFDPARNLYLHNRPRIVMKSAFCGCGHIHAELQEGWDEVAKRISDYIGSLQGFTSEAREAAMEVVLDFLAAHKATDFATPEVFARDVYNEVITVFQGVFDREEVARALRDNITPAYSFFRLSDFGGLPGSAYEFVFNSVDRRALAFMEGVDQFYLSKFVSNDRMRAGAVNYLTEQYLENGEAIFGRTSNEAIQVFRMQFDDLLRSRSDRQVQSIVESSVQRMRGYARTQQFVDAGFAYKKLVPADDACDICAPLRNERVEITSSSRQMEREVDMAPGEFQTYLNNLPRDVDGLQGLYLSGNLLVPLHPNCRCQERVVVED